MTTRFPALSPAPVHSLLRLLDSPFGPDPATVADWLRLRADPLWSGEGVPRADGTPVLLVPGFAAPALSMEPLRAWFARLGYAPRIAEVGRGIGCAERTAVRLQRELEEAAADAGPALLVGHSRGGQFARVSAARRPDLVAGLATLGTPFELVAGMQPLTLALAGIVGLAGTAGVPGVGGTTCVRGTCCEDFRRDLRGPWPPEIPFASIYTRSDRTVRWRSCIDEQAQNVEVSASHVSMLVSRQTYAFLAEFAAALPAPQHTRGSS